MERLGETELVVSDRYCDPLERPAPEEECQEPCPAHCVLGDWSPWTRCRDVSTNTNTSEYTQSGVPSIMMEKLAQAGVGGGCTTIKVTITYKVAVYAPADWAETLTLFLSLSIYVLCGKH